jgi:MoaA/NifB/PqqE/SkfB family radical SAM enzyme
MSPEQLKISLESQFKILCLVDLADAVQSISAVHKIFKEHFKESFEPTERIVFYSEQIPSNELITYIQHAADLFDISRCFIMICCPEESNNLFQSADNFDIEHYPVTVTSKFLPDIIPTISDTMCPYPWMHLAILNLGDVRPCCVSQDIIGSVTEQSLENIFKSPQMDTLRSELLAGKKPAGCSTCWDQESQNIPSVRQWKLKYTGKQLYSDWIDNPMIHSVDYRPSNVCNFKCRICKPSNSSLIAAEEIAFTDDIKKISKLKQINIEGKWFDHDDQFISQLFELLPFLENIDFYGGEPFLLKQLPLLLKKATETNHAEHIRLHFNTNGSVYPTNLIPYFQKFKLVDLSFSIDDMLERFELQRGGSWAEVEHNIKMFKNESSVNFNIAIMTTVNIQNILYLEDLFEWADQNNYEIHLNVLEGPPHLNIDYMTESAKKLVVEKYQTHLRPELQNISRRIMNSPGSNGKKFVSYMQELDKRRKQSFSDSHYEIAIAMGYSV